MKYIIFCYCLFVLPCFGGWTLGAYSFDGVTIRRDIPDDAGRIDFNFPREIKILEFRAIVDAADKFVAKAFGDDTESSITSVSLRQLNDRQGNKFWCWFVGYRQLEKERGVGKDGVFYVVISTEGKSLMKIDM